MGLLQVLYITPCRDVIFNKLRSYLYDYGTSLLALNLTSKGAYVITQQKLSEHFFLRYALYSFIFSSLPLSIQLFRINGEMPFPRRTFTSVMVHNNYRPKQASLFHDPPITHMHLIGYDRSSSNFIPPTVTRLTLSSAMNIPLPTKIFPPNLTHLCLPTIFNSRVSNLPATLTHVYFGSLFNQPVCTMLNFSLKREEKVYRV
jgi:hypothetical protein